VREPKSRTVPLFSLRSLISPFGSTWPFQDKILKKWPVFYACGELFVAPLIEHLGFQAGKREEDASPDPWWFVGDVAIVFEDHADASADATLDATKARQAASHPDWLREHVPGTASATIQSVLVTPAKKAKEGAVPHLCHFAH
jgi:hypothetical protein